MIKVILFDCWGTLFTSGQINGLHPFEKFARAIGCSLKDRDYLKLFEKEFMSSPLKDLRAPVKNLLKKLSLETTSKTIDELEEILNESISTQQAYGDTLSSLSELKEQYRLVLVTNSFNIAFYSLRTKYALGEYFEKIYTSYDMHLIKPDPVLFRTIIKDLQCLPGEVVMIGDSLEDDIQPAELMGMNSILIDRTDKHPDIINKLSNLSAVSTLLQRI